MIAFWILFLLIILISLLLTYLSMKDFEEGPEDFGPDNGLFLIRKQHPLTIELLDYIIKVLKKKSVIISLERLFKGGESALCLYGPKKAISKLTKALDLIELEDYTDAVDIAIWQMGTKTLNHKMTKSFFSDFPKLEDGEQVWFQMVLQPASRGEHFRCQIRGVIVSGDARRKKQLALVLQVPRNNLLKVPMPFSTLQMMDFYKKRSIVGRTKVEFSAGDIIRFWSLPKV